MPAIEGSVKGTGMTEHQAKIVTRKLKQYPNEENYKI